MKLKYYMRGLGIGIILTTLILTLGNRKISDEEVIQRATALGMTFVDKEDTKLNDMLGNGEAVTPVVTVTVAPSQAPSVKPTSEPTATVEPTKVPTPTVTVAPTNAPEPTVAAKPTTGPNNEQGKDKKISVTIKKGMDSFEVADALVKAGIIKDSHDFNKYIVKVGKASYISVGEFKIKKGASYDEIIKIITLK